MTNQPLDLIFGVTDKYSWEQIKPWAVSIRESGFHGEVLLLVYRGDRDRIIEECDALEIQALCVDHDNMGQPIQHAVRDRDTQCHQMRLFHLWQHLNFDERFKDQLPYRYIIATDTRDVLFQRNPSEWLVEHIGNSNVIVAPSENVKYKNEPWGADNVINGFGPILMEAAKEWEICNVGTIAGPAHMIKGLALIDYLMGENRYIPNDQSGFNIMINSGLISVYKAGHSSGWAFQAGTTLDPEKFERYSPHWVEPAVGLIDESGHAYTHKGDQYYLFHQWDRIPLAKEAITKRYGIYGQY